MTDENKDITAFESEEEKEKAEFFKEFENMRPDLMLRDDWTDKQKEDASQALRPASIKTGMFSSIPMKCHGFECPFAESCILLDKGINPEGGICPIETSFVQQFFYGYVEELDVDVTSMVEVSMIRDLVDQEIQHIRKAWALSQEHFIQENVVGLDENGAVITRKELHPAIKLEDSLLKRKENLRKAFLATRESKAKAGVTTKDSAQVVANILDEVRRVELERENRLKSELGMAEFDEYIIDAEIEED